MLDGRPLIDAHQHPVRLPTVKPAWLDWAERYGQPGWRDAYRSDGMIIPAAFDGLMRAEGVDHALVICEYSPKATGTQPAEDLLPLVRHNPARFSLIANLNPHLHYPPGDELADPALLIPVLRDFPELTVVLAHGGRGWWYDTAASLALLHENVWIELSGLPPHRLPHYYARFELTKLARKFIFGTDWPGVPGIARNARALAGLGLDEDVLAGVLAGHAISVYPGLANMLQRLDVTPS